MHKFQPVYNSSTDEVRVVNLQEHSSIVTIDPDTIPTIADSPALEDRVR